jgi:hypothetical protein
MADSEASVTLVSRRLLKNFLETNMRLRPPRSVQPSQECEERRVLAGRVAADRKLYVGMIRELRDDLLAGEFREVYDRGERARVAYEAAMEALRSHLRIHRCAEET